MKNDERRNQVLDLIKLSENPINGSTISKQMGVSRQVIVQDVALLRANKHNIISTNRGYMLSTPKQTQEFTRVIKVSHTDDQIRDELSCIINLSGRILDVWVDHEVYGKFSAELNISNDYDIEKFVLQIQDNKVTPLKNITNNCHYHTISAPTLKLLDLIEQELIELGFIVND